MSKTFDSILEKYRTDILEEQPPDPAAAAPMPDPAAGANPGNPVDPAAAEEPPTPDPEEVIDDLEKSSKKPWVDLAGVLARAMDYRWTDEDIKRLNDSMPSGLTMRDFINVRESPNIRDKFDANIVSAAVTFFDQVDKLMGENDMDEVIPAEER